MQYLSMLLRKCIHIIGKPCVWYVLALVALLSCVNIEYGLFLLPSRSAEFAGATNNIILALSYSYIAAALFHLIVNFCPQKEREHIFQPFINHNLWMIQEYLRQCKKVVLPFFNLSDKQYTEEEYIELFANTDFFEKFPLSNNQSKFDRFEDFRNKIVETITLLLSYREYLTDKQFGYLANLQKSYFILTGLIPQTHDCDNYYCNQRYIGKEIFDLYKHSMNVCV